MKKIIVNNNDTFVNPITHSKMTMDLLEIKDEPTMVSGTRFNNNHYYNVRKDSNDHKLYQWFEHPDYNLKSDYKKYRHLFNLMFPSQIKRLRKRYNLSQRELGAIFGMSYSTISDIESGNYIQSVAQNIILRNLLNPDLMYNLIKCNLNGIKLRHPSHVHSDILLSKARTIHNLEN